MKKLFSQKFWTQEYEDMGEESAKKEVIKYFGKIPAGLNTSQKIRLWAVGRKNPNEKYAGFSNSDTSREKFHVAFFGIPYGHIYVCYGQCSRVQG